MVTQEQVIEFLKEQAKIELEEDKELTQQLIDLAASKGRQIIAVVQVLNGGLVANAVWGVQKIK
jgi:hypothetical protein